MLTPLSSAWYKCSVVRLNVAYFPGQTHITNCLKLASLKKFKFNEREVLF
jgi:hypothetical protein